MPKGSELAGAAIRSARSNLARLWPLWVLASLISGTSLIAGQATEVIRAHVHIYLWPQRLAYDLLVSVGPLLCWGLALRAILIGGRWWRVDRPLLEAVALVAGWNLFGLLVGDAANFAHQVLSPPLGLALSLGDMLVSVLLVWVGARLALWPVARLVRDYAFPAIRSWNLMRGAVWPYVVGAIVLAGPPAIVGAILYAPYRRDGAVWHVVAASPFLGLATPRAASLTAQLFMLRTGFSPRPAETLVP